MSAVVAFPPQSRFRSPGLTLDAMRQIVGLELNIAPADIGLHRGRSLKACALLFWLAYARTYDAPAIGAAFGLDPAVVRHVIWVTDRRIEAQPELADVIIGLDARLRQAVAAE
jgi:hypothetical protein